MKLIYPTLAFLTVCTGAVGAPQPEDRHDLTSPVDFFVPYEWGWHECPAYMQAHTAYQILPAESRLLIPNGTHGIEVFNRADLKAPFSYSTGRGVDEATVQTMVPARSSLTFREEAPIRSVISLETGLLVVFAGCFTPGNAPGYGLNLGAVVSSFMGSSSAAPISLFQPYSALSLSNDPAAWLEKLDEAAFGAGLNGYVFSPELVDALINPQMGIPENFSELLAGNDSGASVGDMYDALNGHLNRQGNGQSSTWFIDETRGGFDPEERDSTGAYANANEYLAARDAALRNIAIEAQSQNSAPEQSTNPTNGLMEGEGEPDSINPNEQEQLDQVTNPNDPKPEHIQQRDALREFVRDPLKALKNWFKSGLGGDTLEPDGPEIVIPKIVSKYAPIDPSARLMDRLVTEFGIDPEVVNPNPYVDPAISVDELYNQFEGLIDPDAATQDGISQEEAMTRMEMMLGALNNGAALREFGIRWDPNKDPEEEQPGGGIPLPFDNP